MNTHRRKFIKNTALGAAGITAGGLFLNSPLKASAPGANDTVRIAIIGLRGRAKALTKAIAGCKNIVVSHICDVDSTILAEHKKYSEKQLGYVPAGEKDFRRLLENQDIDAIAIATPEHWHAPMAIMGLQAGKHVYVEKPCAHNPAENEMLIKAWKRYGKVCQMGNQQRSSRTSNMAVRDIKDGVIGEVYHGKAWYANDRDSIGRGKVIPVPDTLDWDLWQGPAPREAYRDNVHPYNWHWFRTWGTGEIHNNGTHEIDVCRWALGVELPERATSTGGRFHFTEDDWEYYDTQIASYEFSGGKMITWEGRSCNAFKPEDKGRGATIHGTEGSMLLDRENYVLYDLAGKVIRHEKEDAQYSSQDTSDTTGFDGLTVNHMQNFVNAIVRDEKQNSDIGDASVSTMLCHYGNIALTVQRSLTIDSETGRILNDPEAMSHWHREYARGWEPTV